MRDGAEQKKPLDVLRVRLSARRVAQNYQRVDGCRRHCTVALKWCSGFDNASLVDLTDVCPYALELAVQIGQECQLGFDRFKRLSLSDGLKNASLVDYILQ